MDSARQFAIQRFATDLLDSIDNLDRALQTVPEASLQETPNTTAESNSDSSVEGTASTHAKDLRALHSGLKMTEEILLNTLRKHGIERFDPSEGEGRKFDPNLDEATFFMKVDGRGEGEVFHTQSKGFTLNGRVIRAAKVGVVKNS
jgi:molecular chaperone GrpE